MTGSDLAVESGRRLRRARRERDMTAVWVAANAGIGRQYLHRIEAGAAEPSDTVRIALAQVLGVQVTDIWSYPDTSNGDAA